MAMRSRIALLLVLVSAFVSFAIAASPTSFCKCTCNSNSTIIALNGEAAAQPSSSFGDGTTTTHTARTCNDCNRQFCLDYNLPICRDVKEEDIFTTCFQRDSAKDQAVVYTFILLTVGLLVYAVLKPYIDKRQETTHDRRTYTAVPSGQGGG